MAARAEGVSFPGHPLRWLVGPALGWVLVTTLIAVIRRRATKPSLPRMSPQWLHSHDREFKSLDY
jgi:hypothetical protein